ncbi:hypothetical protein V6N13_082317 [Hibiscus sabdariffa]|uniref:Uncharacterized protein n=1 Tax=Hibiscus sabdariffa TaxID=183260 RepID=A0ABR2Q322_9ROSI
MPVLLVVGMPLQAFFATMLLKKKSEPPLEKHEINAQPNPYLQNGEIQAPPSFDPGIWSHGVEDSTFLGNIKQCHCFCF